MALTFPRRNFLPPPPTRTDDLTPRLLSHTQEVTTTGTLHTFVIEVLGAHVGRLLETTFASGRTFTVGNEEFLISSASAQAEIGTAHVTLVGVSLREAMDAGRRLSAQRLGPAPVSVSPAAPAAPVLAVPVKTPARRIIL